MPRNLTRFWTRIEDAAVALGAATYFIGFAVAAAWAVHRVVF
jgi:hypothetical protein